MKTKDISLCYHKSFLIVLIKGSPPAGGGSSDRAVVGIGLATFLACLGVGGV